VSVLLSVNVGLGEPALPALLVSHRRPGFYMRVLREGRIQAGDQIVKTATGPGAVSVADADALLYLPGRDQANLARAVQIPALSPGWRHSFRELLQADPTPVSTGPAWPGFRALHVTKVIPESADVSSLYLAAADGSAPGGPGRPVPLPPPPTR
jgi:hypothetical protein